MQKLLMLLKKNRILRFFVVGVLNTGLDFLLFNIFLLISHNWELGSWQPNVCSTASATIVSFISYELNSRFVFKSGKRLPAHYRIYFLGIVLVSVLILQNLVFKIVIPNSDSIVKLADYALSLVGLNLNDSFIRNNIAKVCATLVMMTWNYKMFKKFIFKPEI